MVQLAIPRSFQDLWCITLVTGFRLIEGILYLFGGLLITYVIFVKITCQCESSWFHPVMKTAVTACMIGFLLSSYEKCTEYLVKRRKQPLNNQPKSWVTNSFSSSKTDPKETDDENASVNQQPSSDSIPSSSSAADEDDECTPKRMPSQVFLTSGTPATGDAFMNRNESPLNPMRSSPNDVTKTRTLALQSSLTPDHSPNVNLFKMINTPLHQLLMPEHLTAANAFSPSQHQFFSTGQNEATPSTRNMSPQQQITPQLQLGHDTCNTRNICGQQSPMDSSVKHNAYSPRNIFDQPLSAVSPGKTAFCPRNIFSQPFSSMSPVKDLAFTTSQRSQIPFVSSNPGGKEAFITTSFSPKQQPSPLHPTDEDTTSFRNMSPQKGLTSGLSMPEDGFITANMSPQHLPTRDQPMDDTAHNAQMLYGQQLFTSMSPMTSELLLLRKRSPQSSLTMVYPTAQDVVSNNAKPMQKFPSPKNWQSVDGGGWNNSIHQE